MCDSHLIRLLGPWEYHPLARTMLLPSGASQDEPGEVPPPGKLTIPADWGETLGSDFRGRVRYRRFFHRPTNLEPTQHVYVVIDHVDASAHISINGAFLGTAKATDGPVMFDITSHLRDRNQLDIEVNLPRETADSPKLRRKGRESLPGGLVGEVRLEIFSGAI